MESLIAGDTGGDSSLNRQSSYLIDRTVRIHQQAPDFYSDIKVITRNHWIPSEQRTCCYRKKCRQKFTFLERPHHCRRCGEVFCWQCTQFRRKLNKLANPDPDGKEYKVCQDCYNQGPQGEGVGRSLLAAYQEARQVCKDVAKAREIGERRAGWRNRLDLEKECQRLIDGFKTELNRSEITKALTELKKMVTVPDWQKGMNYLQEDLNTKCQTCGLAFSRLLNKKHHCRVCALAVCGKCSTQNLLLYVPDSKMPSAPDRGPKIPAIMSSTLGSIGDLLRRSSQTVEPELTIIEIVGCPDTEPNISIYLRVCEPCKTALTEIQVKRHRDSIKLVEDDFLTKLQKLFEHFWDLRKKIDQRLEKYCTTIDSLENNSAGSQQKGVQSQSNMKVLAKAQADLSDFFTAYIMKVQQLKQLKQLSQTPAQAKLYQAFVKSKCEYYMENMYTFRNGRKKLAAISPPEVLELIQNIVDKDVVLTQEGTV